MIAAEAHTPLEQRAARSSRRRSASSTSRRRREPHVDAEEEDLVATLSRGDPRAPARRARVPEGGRGRAVDSASSSRTRSSASCRTGTCTRGTARATRERSFRLDRMRSARLLDDRFEPRDGFEPHELRDARVARVCYSPEIARWQVERGATPARATAARSARFASAAASGSSGEMLQPARRGGRARARGAARARSRERARELAQELGVSPRCRVPRLGRRQREREGRALARARERTSSVPPCASAIERAMKSPSPVPGHQLARRARARTSRRSAAGPRAGCPARGR